MKHPLRAAALAAGALLCLTASEAFAYIEVIAVADANSWTATVSFAADILPGPPPGPECTWDHIELTALPIGTPLVFPGVAPGNPNGPGPYLTFVDSLFEPPVIIDPLFSAPPSPFWAQDTAPAPSTTFVGWSDTTNALEVFTQTINVHFANPLAPGATTGVGGFSLLAYSGGTWAAGVYTPGTVVAFGTIYIDKFDSTGFEAVTSFNCGNPIPVPAALWTGLPMLGGMILLVRRNKRRVLS
jgi:hypothetical protein